MFREDTPCLENAHQDLWRSENYVDQSERAWLRWVKQVERLLGHSIDGNQDTDGYSLDFAYEAWKTDQSPAAYVKAIVYTTGQPCPYHQVRYRRGK